MDAITALNFLSEPGIYEIETADGPTYELSIPADLSEPGVLLISKYSGVEDDHTDRNLLTLVDTSLQVSERGDFSLFENDDVKEVKTKIVKSILKVK